jgi:hypothetical protein
VIGYANLGQNSPAIRPAVEWPGQALAAGVAVSGPPAEWVLSTWLVEPPLLAAASGLIWCFSMEGIGIFG